jgi:hypothetical protein
MQKKTPARQVTQEDSAVNNPDIVASQQTVRDFLCDACIYGEGRYKTEGGLVLDKIMYASNG